MGLPMSYNIKLDPKEENPVTPIDTWVRWNTFGIVNEHRDSLEREPPIPLGAPDPWVPRRMRGSPHFLQWYLRVGS